jgi:flavin reductase (DIM6/NTAB) family NADH-FMN oxidoreductase RutF
MSTAPVPLDDALFKLAMSHFASGVTVVTTVDAGIPHGLTVASFASLSLHPPLVVICIETATKSHDAIANAGKFGVSILGADQAAISGRFASKEIDDRFEGVAVRTGVLGVPLIENAICTIECRVYERLPGGDHTIFAGEVVAAHTREGAPLVYFRSGYQHLA